MRARRSFTAEFKAEVGAHVRRRDRSVAEICRDMDLVAFAVRRWVSQADTDEGRRSGATSAEREEIRNLSIVLADHPLTSSGLSILSCAGSLEGAVVMGHPLTLPGFMAMDPPQDACRRALLEQRWREGLRGPRCAHALAW